MPKPPKRIIRTSLVRWLVSAVLLAAAAMILAHNWSVVTNSARVARDASVSWYGLALLLTVLTYCIAAAIYVTLALHRVRYGQTVLIEASTAFVNRLLPSGIGGLGVHGLYLYRRAHTPTEATAVVSVNNLLGMAAHWTLLGLVFVFSPAAVSTLSKHYHVHVTGWGLVAVSVLLLCLVTVRPLRERIGKFVANLVLSMRKIGLARTLRAFLLAMLLTVTYTSILFASTRAIGLQLDPLQVFMVFSIGMLAGTATPTPGGLVGMEAGLFTALVGYGVTGSLAGAAVLLYRLATYWLPLLPGVAALGVARSRKLL